MASHLWIVYDERAMTMDTDDCAVMESCSSEHEAMHKAQPGVVFRYDIAPPDKPGGRELLINEMKIGPNHPLQKEWKAVTR
jgi:hypothetical protein